jgi:hypothetical protein
MATEIKGAGIAYCDLVLGSRNEKVMSYWHRQSVASTPFWCARWPAPSPALRAPSPRRGEGKLSRLVSHWLTAHSR